MKSKKISFKGMASAAAEERAKRTSGYGYLNLPRGTGVFAPDPGKSVTLDFFPYVVSAKNHPDKHEESGRATKGSYWYKRPFKIHRNVGSDNETVVCLGSINKPCPICEYKLKRAKEGADKDEIKALRPGERSLYVVNPLDSAKHEAGKLYVMDISEFLFQEFLDKEMKEDVPDDFFDPEEGVSLKIRFAASTMGTSKPFAEADKITVKDRAKQYKASFYDQAPCLDDLLNIMTYEELWAKFFEVDKEETDEDEAPRSKKSTKKVVEEDDDDDDEPAPPVRKKKAPVEEDDDDEPTPPVRKKKEPEPEPEEEEEDDDDKLSWDDLENLNAKQLIKYCKANDLDVDFDEFEGDDAGLRKAMAKELGIKIPKTAKKELPPKADRCIACGGTGVSSKGGVCKPCAGTGVKQKPVEDDDDDDEPVAKKTTKPEKKKSKSEDECPSDHEFGKDVDKFDECDSCDLWDDCMAAKKKNK